ncbi:uncharacterized protein LOC110918021 [Helianthus annuus]|uniref:uncharacterized protein LOC110918021 n=1 Tax=Helianthus annuus TaxID=4232 RepID=UPI000B9046B7|nr:uncharacterized protein LOC110918021 [Helianthus annuus]
MEKDCSSIHWLNPAFWYDKEKLCKSKEVFKGVLEMVEKNFSGDDVIDVTMALGKFHDDKECFGRSSVIASRRVIQPAEWWRLSVNAKLYCLSIKSNHIFIGL